MVLHTWNHITQEVEVGRSGVEGWPWLHRETEDRPGRMFSKITRPFHLVKRKVHRLKTDFSYLFSDVQINHLPTHRRGLFTVSALLASSCTYKGVSQASRFRLWGFHFACALSSKWSSVLGYPDNLPSEHLKCLHTNHSCLVSSFQQRQTLSLSLAF